MEHTLDYRLSVCISVVPALVSISHKSNAAIDDEVSLASPFNGAVSGGEFLRGSNSPPLAAAFGIDLILVVRRRAMP